MDPGYSAQDVTRCDLCKTTIAQSYCDFCHINLCKPCIGEHISDDYSKKHIIVPFQQRRSTLIYPKCTAHKNEDCKYQCKNCNIFVCFECVVSNQHQGHQYSKLEDIFTALKMQIEKDEGELENLILPKYGKIAVDLESQIDSLDGKYEKLTIEMSKLREEMHREIDNAINQMEMEIGEIKVKHHSILQKHLDEIKEIQALIQQSQTDLNELKETNKVCLTIQYTSKNAEYSHFPPKLKVTMPEFQPKQIKREDLFRLFGELIPLSTTLEERVFTAKELNTSVRELLDKPEVLNTIKTGHHSQRSVTCLNDEHTWTSGMTADINCFNIQSLLQNKIKTKSGEWPIDIAVDNDGTVLYSDETQKTVYKVKNGQTEEIITLQGWKPAEICVTSSGDLLVIMYGDDYTQSKVVRYSGFSVKQIIQFDDEGKSLYSGYGYTKYISENRNLDICVADYRASAVVVVNQAGKLRFRYSGHSSTTKTKPFKPFGITTDSQSHILTVDWDNHCIHILDSNGQFLRYIDNCDLKYPYGLCVDSNDNLFVCEYDEGNVKKIKYIN
uniref:Probable E3 ubiquitin-protein ligase MID2 n=1 Tax=Crassostrea virginica TaxID=6565 RepID=A0A8B8B2C9_CRAVI|nr:probable E3 ubiquitin-protein ligase MID2 [Crassostrea virginica]